MVVYNQFGEIQYLNIFMKFEHKIFWKTSIILMLISSCKKEKIPCTGNCTDITI